MEIIIALLFGLFVGMNHVEESKEVVTGELTLQQQFLNKYHK